MTESDVKIIVNVGSNEIRLRHEDGSLFTIKPGYGAQATIGRSTEGPTVFKEIEILTPEELATDEETERCEYQVWEGAADMDRQMGNTNVSLSNPNAPCGDCEQCRDDRDW